MTQETIQEITLLPPSLTTAATHLKNRDDLEDQMALLTANMENAIKIRTKDLEEQIQGIREEEEARIHEEMKFLEIERDNQQTLYRESVNACLSAGIMNEGRYYLRNTTSTSHPINAMKFRERFSDIYDKSVTIQKNTALANIVAIRGCSQKVANALLLEVCDSIPSGLPKWELEVSKRKGEVV